MREYNEELFSIIVKLTRWPLALSNEMDERLMCPGRCTSNGRKHCQRGMNGRKVQRQLSESCHIGESPPYGLEARELQHATHSSELIYLDLRQFDLITYDNKQPMMLVPFLAILTGTRLVSAFSDSSPLLAWSTKEYVLHRLLSCTRRILHVMALVFLLEISLRSIITIYFSKMSCVIQMLLFLQTNQG